MDEKNNVRRETTKAVWEAPTIEEIDYARTEAAYVQPGSADLGIYSV
jgi:hypothetical protein